jgi:hypothetical protein
VIERIKTGIGRTGARVGRNVTGHRKVAVVVAAVCIVSIAGTGLLVWPGLARSSPASTPAPATASPTASPIPSPTSSPTPSPSPSPSPTIDTNPTAIPSGWAYSDLDGVAAPPDLAHRLPLAVMIDDNKVARPQAGFSSASIVYQAPADGGEDRYMMVFQEGTAADIGPVRSARQYFVRWATEYKAMFGHFGGDHRSLQEVIPALANYLYNMDDLNGGSCPYRRISTRAAPHNAYTTSADLLRCILKRGYPTTFQKLPVRTFVDDSLVAELPASQSISIPYRTGTIGYTFDPATDSYLRLVDGSLQIDPANNQQVVARNIVVMFQSLTYENYDGVRPVVANVGSGKAIVFKEGRAIAGTWKKTSNTALTRIYDASGQEIPLVRGEIFMQSVPIGTAVSYK